MKLVIGLWSSAPEVFILKETDKPKALQRTVNNTAGEG